MPKRNKEIVNMNKTWVVCFIEILFVIFSKEVDKNK